MAQDLEEGTACECGFREGREGGKRGRAGHTYGTPKSEKKNEGSLTQCEEELVTSIPANSIEAGDVGNLDTNLYSVKRDPRTKFHFSASQGVWSALGGNPGR